MQNNSIESTFNTNNLLDKILNSISDGVFTLNSDKEITYFNDSASILLNKSKQEVLNKNIKAALPELYTEKFKGKVEKIDKEVENIEFEMSTQSDKFTDWFNIKLLPIEENIIVFLQLITEKKNYEQKIKAEKNKLRSLIDGLPDSIFVKDKSSKFITANSSMVKYFSKTNESELIGRTDFDIFTQEHAQQAFDDEQEIIRTGEPIINKEERETWPDGSISWVSTSKMPYYNEKDEIIGTIGISKNITERKVLENQLKQAADIVANIQSGIYIYYLEDLNDDSSLRLISANPAAEVLSGVKNEDILGNTINENFPGLIEKGIPKAYADVVREQRPIQIEDFYYGDNRMIHGVFSIKAFPLPENKVGISFDNITERKKSQDEVKRSILMLETILDTIPVRVFWKDLELNFLGCNKKFAKDAGFDTPEQLIGKNDYQMPWNEEAEKYRRDDQEIIDTGIAKLNIEEMHPKSSGENVWLKTDKVPLKNIHGTIVGILGIYVDITEKRNAELEIKETNQSLEEMVYIASHDLQVPLVSMEGYASELVEAYKDKLDEEGVYCLTRLQHNARRMHKLVLSLLNISRLNTRKFPHESFSLDQVIDKIIKDLTITIEKSQATITHDKLPKIHADRIRIEGVIRNIVTNAINYNGKNIHIGTKDDTTIFIKDDGIGIPGDQLEKVFHPGERIKMLKVDGVGMGLTFCRKVIHHHNGKIWAESDGVDKGSTFFITFDKKNIIH